MGYKGNYKYVCQRCGQPVGEWYYGWKHQTGWHSKPSCGLYPIPVEKPPGYTPPKKSNK